MTKSITRITNMIFPKTLENNAKRQRGLRSKLELIIVQAAKQFSMMINSIGKEL